MPSSAEYMNLPFDEAIQYFRQKINLPTETWKDLWKGMHSRAFVVAGAVKGDLLSDLRGAVDKAISKGTTLAEFRKDFDNIVGKHGWVHTGEPGWRAATIYNTNLSTAYHAAHWKSMTDPDVLRFRPYLQYLASSSAERRPEHTGWYNTVLPADDPWWRTHYPPNGWGCKCGVASLSKRDLERLQEEAAKGGTPVRTEAPKVDHYEWTDKATSEVHQVPRGIDPGWDYNVGEAAWGRRLSEQTMDEWRAQKGKAWDHLTPGDWASEGRPQTVPIDVPKAKPGPVIEDPEDAVTALKNIIGGEEKVFETPGGAVLVNAESLIDHISREMKARSPFLPLLPEILTDPFEVWISFERHKGTGLVVLRERFFKVVQTDKKRALIIVAQAKEGVLEAWTMFPRSKVSTLKNERRGKLLYGRD